MAFIIENLRLKELALVAEQNRSAFGDLVYFLKEEGYGSLHSFIVDKDVERCEAVLRKYLARPFPKGVTLYDGIARPYAPVKAKWLLLGWILRDAPEQRLRPMISSMPGKKAIEKQAYILNQLRGYISDIFPEPSRWEWASVSEVMIDRLEGSRRSIKGTLFEAIVRLALKDLFEKNSCQLEIKKTQIKLHGETYDVSVSGKNGQILIPVKTRETMGGGHALLFTRDIHKSITAAHEGKFDCIPIIIAESWSGDLKTLACKDFIYINMNPNQVVEVGPILANALATRIDTFRSIM